MGLRRRGGPGRRPAGLVVVAASAVCCGRAIALISSPKLQDEALSARHRQSGESGRSGGLRRRLLGLLETEAATDSADVFASAGSGSGSSSSSSRVGASFGIPGPPSKAPLYYVNMTFDSKHHSAADGVTFAVDAPTRTLRLEPGVDQSSGVAWARFEDKLSTTGWMELIVETTDAALVSNTMRMYGAGYAEGVLTAPRISQFYSNFWQILPKSGEANAALVNIQNMMYREIKYIKKKTKLEKGVGHGEPTDPYWKHIRYLFVQLWGIRDGYNAIAKKRGTAQLDLIDIFLVNMHAELPELMEAYTPVAAKERRKFQAIEKNTASLLQKSDGAESLGQAVQRGLRRLRGDGDAHAEAHVEPKAAQEAADRDWEDRLTRHGHCSALVRLTPENRDLLIGHTTWNDYSKMTRVFKYYTFKLPGTDSAATLVAFSSYPGCASSTDNFYMMDSGLAVMDTSIEVLNAALYDRVPDFPSNPKIPNFMHTMAVNRLAHTGVDWTNLYLSRNCGTPSSQWLVVDYNKFIPTQPVQDNTLRLVEQVPGMSHEGDVSGVLRSQGYWASFNRPYFAPVRDLSGHTSAEAKYGALYSFANAPRAQIFKHLAPSIRSTFDMRTVMNRNRYPAEGILPNEPGHAISARMDLDPVSHLPNGGIDAKVASRCLFRLLQCQAISGPTHDSEPVFRWKSPDGAELFSGWPHLGLPDAWDFNWAQMTPSGLVDQAVDNTC